MDVLKSLSPHAHWILRIVVAAVFLYHGPTKFMMDPLMGMNPLMWYLVGAMETLGALLLLYGGLGPDWATRLGGLLLIPVMLGAIFMVHWGQWSFVASESHPMGGMEFQVTLLGIALYFLIRGNEA